METGNTIQYAGVAQIEMTNILAEIARISTMLLLLEN